MGKGKIWKYNADSVECNDILFTLKNLNSDTFRYSITTDGWSDREETTLEYFINHPNFYVANYGCDGCWYKDIAIPPNGEKTVKLHIVKEMVPPRYKIGPFPEYRNVYNIGLRLYLGRNPLFYPPDFNIWSDDIVFKE